MVPNGVIVAGMTANNQSKTYGGVDPTLTFTPSGTLYGSDTYAVISGV